MKIKFIFLLLFVTTFSFGQNGSKSIDETIDILKKQQGASFFEVSKEMFEMLSKAENTPPQLKKYYSQLTKIKMLEEHSHGNNQNSTDDLYGNFLEHVNLKNFARLMVSESAGEKFAFYKKQGSGAENQFLLVSNTSVIYVVGSIDLNSIQEFQVITEIAGSTMGR